jgi:hypothetical protein
MTKERNKRLIGVVAGGLCGLGVLTAAASPPFVHGRSSPSAIDSARNISTAAHAFARQGLTPTTQLDLRLRGESPSAVAHGGVDPLGPAPLSFSTHHVESRQV